MTPLMLPVEKFNVGGELGLVDKAYCRYFPFETEMHATFFCDTVEHPLSDTPSSPRAVDFICDEVPCPTVHCHCPPQYCRFINNV